MVRGVPLMIFIHSYSDLMMKFISKTLTQFTYIINRIYSIAYQIGIEEGFILISNNRF